MKLLLLTLWLSSGQMITEDISDQDCWEAMAYARFAQTIEGFLIRDDDSVLAMACGDEAIVLGLDGGDGPCETEPQS